MDKATCAANLAAIGDVLAGCGDAGDITLSEDHLTFLCDGGTPEAADESFGKLKTPGGSYMLQAKDVRKLHDRMKGILERADAAPVEDAPKDKAKGPKDK